MEGLVSLGFPVRLDAHGCGWTADINVWRQENWRHAGGGFNVLGSLSWKGKKVRGRRRVKGADISLSGSHRRAARVASSEGSEAALYTERVDARTSRSGESVSSSDRHLLCLSNGHGEDAIAVTILKELQALAAEKGEQLLIQGLPLVGLGNAYTRAGIPLVGPAQVMPSGGFIYMDAKQLVGDVKAGLLSLFLQQWQAVTAWTDEHPGGAILAVGDVLPLAVAWLAAKRRKRMSPPAERDGRQSGRTRYGFVGTAKSEFYVRDGEGRFLTGDKLRLIDRLLYKDGVHFPWERALMADDDCRLVAPRDGLTADVLRQGLPPSARAKVKDAGNPMMDGLQPTGLLDPVLAPLGGARVLVILPGSRAPEVYENWNLLLKAATATSATLSTATNRRTIFVAPVVPSISLTPFAHAVTNHGWRQISAPDPATWRSPLPEDAELASDSSKPGPSRTGASWQSHRAPPGREKNGTADNAELAPDSTQPGPRRTDASWRPRRAPPGTGDDFSPSSDPCSQKSDSGIGAPGSASWRAPAHVNADRAPDQAPVPRGTSATWQHPRTPPGTHAGNASPSPDPCTRRSNTGECEDKERASMQVFHLGGGSEGRGYSVAGPPPLLVLLRGGFADCIQVAEAGLAMAGTATEQLVGLGKPVFTLSGKGPQFTPTFAEAQSRLLGRAVFYCEDASTLHLQVAAVLDNQELLSEVAEEGHRRMGDPGAGKKIASMAWSAFW